MSTTSASSIPLPARSSPSPRPERGCARHRGAHPRPAAHGLFRAHQAVGLRYRRDPSGGRSGARHRLCRAGAVIFQGTIRDNVAYGLNLVARDETWDHPGTGSTTTPPARQRRRISTRRIIEALPSSAWTRRSTGYGLGGTIDRGAVPRARRATRRRARRRLPGADRNRLDRADRAVRSRRLQSQCHGRGEPALRHSDRRHAGGPAFHRARVHPGDVLAKAATSPPISPTWAARSR